MTVIAWILLAITALCQTPTDCQTSLLLQLTNIYETSHPNFTYNVCVTLADGHGYSAGIIQFTTGTGSAQEVISDYSNRSTPNEVVNLFTSL